MSPETFLNGGTAKVVAKNTWSNGKFHLVEAAPQASTGKDVAIGFGKGLLNTFQQAGAQNAGPVGADMLRNAPQLKDVYDRQQFDLIPDNTAQALGTGLGAAAEILTPMAASPVAKLAARAIPEVVAMTKNIGATAVKSGNMAVKSGNMAVNVIADRVPRFMGRVKDAVQESAVRAQVIKSSPPPVANAIKTGLDDRVINTVRQADAPTINAYKEMVDIAGDTSKTLKLKQRPEIVAGKAAEDQYKVIDKQKKTIGKEIGAAVDKLSRTTKVPIEDARATLTDVLSRQGIQTVISEKGVYLDFATSRFTPAERTRIKELYRLANEGGGSLTPRQIRDKDQLFSKLQREARFEGIGDIIVETDQGNMSLFRVFRDVYANKLDEVSPEIRALNRQYRNLTTLTDDVENSIIKSGKFETTKNVDDAEFAQTNLRRLLSDAQSAADYRQIVAEMDKVSRSLGYTGANAEDLIAFATELRNIYPDAVPATSLPGSIRTSISGIIDKIVEIGAPNQADKQKALRELLEAAIAEQKL